MKKLLVLFLLAASSMQAAYTLRNGKLINSDIVATMSVQEHYSAAMDAYQKSEWEEVIHQSLIVIKNFPTTPFAQDAFYYLGVGYFQIADYELANQHLTTYLKKQSTPKYFEEAIQYKFQIAQQFQLGAKKHLMGWESMPKWIPAKEEAIAIYDEVITALPHHDLAAHSLFGKAELLLKEEEYTSSIETYQTLIRRFPKHPLSVESYIGVAQVFLTQSQEQYPDQDFLDLAEINLRKFRQDFPGEEKIVVAEKLFEQMQEVYASQLYDIGRFYERTKKHQASYIYYTRIIAKYPETQVALLANKRLENLKIKPNESIPAPKVKKNNSSPTTKSEEQSPTSPLLELPANNPIVQAEKELKSPLEEGALEVR